MSDPITLGLSLGFSAGTGILSIFQATAAEDFQERVIREQQLQARLAYGQRSLQRMDQLQHTLAENQVMAAVGNVSQASGTFRAIQEKSFGNFEQDENADALNFGSQQLALQQRLIIAKQNMASSILNSVASAGNNIFSSLMTYNKIPAKKTLDTSGGNLNQTTTGIRQNNDQVDINE